MVYITYPAPADGFIVFVAYLLMVVLCFHRLQIPPKQFPDGSVDEQILFLKIKNKTIVVRTCFFGTNINQQKNLNGNDAICLKSKSTFRLITFV